jgi:hypothetical protein
MPINALIAQGVDPIGRDVPQIAQMLEQRRQDEAQQQRQNALFDMREKEFAAQQAQNARITGRQDKQWAQEDENQKNGRIAASTQWMLQALESGQSVDLSQASPEVQQTMQELADALLKNGHDPSQMSPDGLKQLLRAGLAKSSAALGQGPQVQWKDDTRQGFAGQTEVGTNKFDPYPQKNAGSGGNPYFTPVYTAGGVIAFDNRTGQIAPAGGPSGGGTNVRRTVDDPTVQADIAGAEKSAQLNAERQQQISVAIQNTKSSDQLLDMAAPLARTATGSYVGAGVDFLSNVFGFAPKGDEAISALQGIQAQLTLMVPRMEGPQGVLDLKLYEAAAGEIGNPRAPTANKMAAIRTIRMLNSKYREMNQSGAPQRGPTATGPNGEKIVLVNGQWVPANGN